MVDDGQGLKQVFRVENFDLVSIPPEDFGKFYSGDCYVILYTYVVNKKEKHIIYFWLVRINIHCGYSVKKKFLIFDDLVW